MSNRFYFFPLIPFPEKLISKEKGQKESTGALAHDRRQKERGINRSDERVRIYAEPFGPSIALAGWAVGQHLRDPFCLFLKKAGQGH